MELIGQGYRSKASSVFNPTWLSVTKNRSSISRYVEVHLPASATGRQPAGAVESKPPIAWPRSRRAGEVFKDDAVAVDWLRTKNRALGDTPIDLLDTEAGADMVERARPESNMAFLLDAPLAHNHGSSRSHGILGHWQ